MTARSEAQERAAGGKPRIGVSSCLLGHSVRHDGGHKRDRYLTDVLAPYFEYVPVCPELAIGLGVPRPAIRLTVSPATPRLVGVKDRSLDVTEDMLAYARGKMAALAGLAGYVLKRGSPSCGMERVKIYNDAGAPIGTGAGLFARALMETYPLLPCEEEGRLGDARLRENFLTRVFSYQRWLDLGAEGLTAGRIVVFHTRHKFLLLAHSEVHYRRAGRLLADAGRHDARSLGAQYIGILMEGLSRRATPRRHANVLQHLMGYLKRDLDGGDKSELLDVIERYRLEQVPLVVPIQLLKHHFRRNPDPYVEFQHYLAPFPDELGLRNAT